MNLNVHNIQFDNQLLLLLYFSKLNLCRIVKHIMIKMLELT